MFPVYRHGEWGTAVRAARHGTVSRVPVNGHDNSERSFSAQRQGPLHEHVTRVDDSTGCNGAHAATTWSGQKMIYIICVSQNWVPYVHSLMSPWSSYASSTERLQSGDIELDKKQRWSHWLNDLWLVGSTGLYAVGWYFYYCRL